MKMSAVALNLFAAVGVIVVGVLLGGLGRFAYEVYQDQDESLPGGEVVNAKGETYTVLAYQPETKQKQAAARAALKQAGIFCQTVDDKLMVYPAEAALALDCLAAEGLVPGTEHFSFTEVTADPESQPRRYGFQQLLAARNTLSKMLPTMSAAVEDAQIRVTDEAGVSRSVRVILRLKSGATLDRATARDMISHVADLIPGVKPQGVHILADSGEVLAEYVPATQKPAAGNTAEAAERPLK